MIAPVASAVGRGPTELAAFDAAPVGAGVADRDLIYLSSVLPPASSVERVDRIGRTPGGWDDRLYCVVAQARTAVPGAQAWAGVGWVRDASGTSLEAVGRNRGLSFPSIGIEVAGVRCVDDPACAPVVAVFESAAWISAGRPAAATACA
ncbi:pyruvoyl-dependent arginine decarboxylase [Actinophytocola sp.]|uniref:pyruvoyl-dependent arginine decarboxylase n=1 Tax=Actinophytocola sp. TaxID=1872138 RepID=UPI002D7E4FC0|nr:pyruvoyl-dependent arginine decarboxylase [Actinophytocola sp.]HET9139469.1 pyruvoyl-dependent arginine decarboxylase [Actinophytocola sp.]HEU5111156.1 pyruvoyl-dependent arginine decarboxylase [Micromonosporaceae bacterium]